MSVVCDTPDDRGIPTRFYASLFSGKLCSAQRAHFMLISLEDNTSKYDLVVEVCIVTDSLGAFCPSFDSWEQASTVTRGSHVSVFGRIVIISM